MLDKVNHIAIAVPDMEKAKQPGGVKLGAIIRPVAVTRSWGDGCLY